MLLIRNHQITDIRRNLKQEKCRVDWLVSQETEILICFPNRQEFVNYCQTHTPHLFGPHANFFIPSSATQPAPWILSLNKNTNIDKGLLSDSELDSDTEHTSLKTTKTKKLKNQKFLTTSLFDSDTETDTEITKIPPGKPTTSKAEQIPHIVTPHQTPQPNQNITQKPETFSQNTALQIHHHTNKCNNPFYIKTLASQLQIHTPKTYWSDKNKITTLIFTNKVELNTFRQQIPENTFGNQAKFYIHNKPTTNTYTQVARETNVVALGVNPDIDVHDIESELSDNGIDFTRVTRIRNSAGNTQLIRIFSKNPDTIKTLLTQGLYLANRRFKVVPPKEETRHTPCHKCQQYGHIQTNCTNQQKCFRCGNQNNSCKHTSLEARAMYCATCDSHEHYTGQMKCPKYPRNTPPPSLPKHTPLITQTNIITPKKPSEFTGQDFPGLETDTSTHTHTITPITYASKITNVPQKPDLELAISVLQLQMEQYVNQKIEQLENKILQFITATFKSTTPPEHKESTTTALNSHSKKIFGKSIQVGKFGPSIDVYITSMNKVKEQFDQKIKELYTNFTHTLNSTQTQ